MQLQGHAEYLDDCQSQYVAFFIPSLTVATLLCMGLKGPTSKLLQVSGPSLLEFFKIRACPASLHFARYCDSNRKDP